tara:strand:+ start:3271 stop:3939 length:669 start_codon:yes stop_codon:yes gene_type:complete
MHFRIHNEGWVYLVVSVIVTIIAFPFFPIIGLFLLFISFCFFYFFRDPIRIIPNENVIISPADGKIVFLGESNLPEECCIRGKFLKISIFLDVFNVHVNRLPMSGTVKDIKYVPGKFFRANVEKSSKENERNIVTIENKKKEKIIVTQIAGLIARRIVCDLKINQEVLKGERFGIIKFGSRVDLYLPINYNLMVSVGQMVIGGETIISNPEHIFNITQSNEI